jgi:hypothetical protein
MIPSAARFSFQYTAQALHEPIPHSSPLPLTLISEKHSLSLSDSKMGRNYQQLPNDDRHEDESSLPRNQAAQRARTFTTFFLGILFSVLIITTLAALFFSRQQHSSPPPSADRYPPTATGLALRNCGSTPSDARSRGCQFDVMSFTWSLPECFDAELMDDFLGHTDWHWYMEDGTEVAQADVLVGDYPYLFVNMEYHMVHCTVSSRFLYWSTHLREADDSPSTCGERCTALYRTAGNSTTIYWITTTPAIAR